jgi:hypothetical protein
VHWSGKIIVKAAHLHAAARIQFKREQPYVVSRGSGPKAASRVGDLGQRMDACWLAWIDKRAARVRRVIKGRRLHIHLHLQIKMGGNFYFQFFQTVLDLVT